MEKKSRIYLSVAAAVFFLLLGGEQSMAGFQFPLESISPVTTPLGRQHLRLGASYNRGERLLFQAENKDRRVYELPSFSLAVGLAPNVELLLSYPLLLLNQTDKEEEYGSGDLIITGVYRLLQVGKIFSDCALTIATKLPNASNQEEFGTDETDFFLGGAVSREMGKLNLLINLDFAILGDPNRVNTQDDLFEYNVGLIYPVNKKLSAALEFAGAETSRRNNDRRFVRGGIAFTWKKFLIDCGGALGLTEESGDFQVAVGVTLKFGIERDPAYWYR